LKRERERERERERSNYTIFLAKRLSFSWKTPLFVLFEMAYFSQFTLINFMLQIILICIWVFIVIEDNSKTLHKMIPKGFY
jgi:hypothetical protein